MGNYNREYEKYYRKINKINKASPSYEMKLNNDRIYREKKKENLGKYIVKDVLFSSIFSCFIFLAFL